MRWSRGTRQKNRGKSRFALFCPMLCLSRGGKKWRWPFFNSFMKKQITAPRAARRGEKKKKALAGRGLCKSVWWPTKSSRPHNHFLLGARFACHEPKMATGHLSSHRKRSSSYASLAFFPNLFCQPIQSIKHDPPVRN